MIDIEVRGRLGQYIKAFLRNVIDSDAIVSYPNREKEDRVPLSNVRLPPANGREVQAGQPAEVLFSIADNQLTGQSGDGGEGFSANWTVEENKTDASLSNQLELAAWWPCRVHKVRDEMAVVKLQVNAPSDASNEDIARCTQLSTVTDIVKRNTLRQPTHDIPFVSPSMIHRHCIEIPKELAEFASDTAVHTEFVRHAGEPVSLFFDKEASTLVVLSTDETVIRNVVLLEETHLKMLRQKWAITRSLKQTMRNLDGTRGRELPHLNMTSSRSSGDWDTDPNLFYERFYVPQRLMGLAIGAQGHNIRACRELPGVVNIRLRETGANRRPGEDNTGEHGDAALFIVEARTAEAAKQARSKLEFTELYLGVPRRYVGRLIGRKTSNILSIIQKSGVVQIHFDDHINGPSEDETLPNLESLNLHHSDPVSSSSPNIQRVFLRAGGAQATSQPHAEEEYGSFVLSGTRDSVEKARLLISFQLDYIYDLEKMEAEKFALIRNLSHTGPESGVGYPNRRGAPTGPPIRGSVGGRDGRRPPRGAPFPPSTSYSDADPMDQNARLSQYPDEAAGYGGTRRPPRTGRGYNGESRPPRQGGRGGPRRFAGRPNSYADWNDPTSNNGDVVDRRRGSADSDALSHEVESDERETIGRYGRGSRPERKRADGGETVSSLATDDDNFPGGDGSSAGEGFPYASEPIRGRGPGRGSQKRAGLSDNAGRGPRNRPPRSRQWGGQNGDYGSTGSRTPQMASNNGSVQHASRQPTQA